MEKLWQVYHFNYLKILLFVYYEQKPRNGDKKEVPSVEDFSNSEVWTVKVKDIQ